MGMKCPTCKCDFLPSHTSRCGLLDGNYSQYLVHADDLRISMTLEGVSAEGVSGVGVVEAAIIDRKWRLIRTMFASLATILGTPDQIDWTGAVY